MFELVVTGMRTHLESLPEELSTDERLARLSMSIGSVGNYSMAAASMREVLAEYHGAEREDGAEHFKITHANAAIAHANNSIIHAGVSRILEHLGGDPLPPLQPLLPPPPPPPPPPPDPVLRLAGTDGSTGMAAAAMAQQLRLMPTSVVPPAQLLRLAGAAPSAAAAAPAAAAAVASASADVLRCTARARTLTYVPTALGDLEANANPVMALWNEFSGGISGAHPLKALLAKDKTPAMELVRIDWVRAIEGNPAFKVKNLAQKYGPFKQLAEHIEQRLRLSVYYTAEAAGARQAALQGVLKAVEEERKLHGSLNKLFKAIKADNNAKKTAKGGGVGSGVGGGDGVGGGAAMGGGSGLIGANGCADRDRREEGREGEGEEEEEEEEEEGGDVINGGDGGQPPPNGDGGAAGAAVRQGEDVGEVPEASAAAMAGVAAVMMTAAVRTRAGTSGGVGANGAPPHATAGVGGAQPAAKRRR